ncbi:membrane lipoprotein lipid attachment site-containing protein [Aquimarina algicola]|uniref:membrane lipoprotein lipid attachment site-containing protein n=1 Tax=Aquimarina algicola TaxID=2589995 RepID=UPI001CF25B99|nr:membrane lipoprotein lipid attachment site-containing protein [Aquimarina algicola]
MKKLLLFFSLIAILSSCESESFEDATLPQENNPTTNPDPDPVIDEVIENEKDI